MLRLNFSHEIIPIIVVIDFISMTIIILDIKYLSDASWGQLWSVISYLITEKCPSWYALAKLLLPNYKSISGEVYFSRKAASFSGNYNICMYVTMIILDNAFEILNMGASIIFWDEFTIMPNVLIVRFKIRPTQIISIILCFVPW